MSTLPKNLSICGKCVATRISHQRQISSGSSSVVDTAKMHAKNIVLSQWKLINGLKLYFSKFTSDKTFENALNKEFAQFLQKIDSKTYGKELVRYFTSDEKDDTKDDAKPKDIKAKSDQNLKSKLKIFSTIGIAMGGKEAKKEVVPKWKVAPKPLVSKEAVASRTSQVISALVVAGNDEMKLKKIDELAAHLEQYPVSKHNAVKEGAIRMLLRIRDSTGNPKILSSANLVCALLGHTDPVPGVGIRILSIDGGGTRGILVIEMLRKLEELSGKPIYEMFDFICGVSTGAIIATLLGLKHKTLDEISEIYKTISAQIFSQSTLSGTSNLLWSHSYYDTTLWEKLLKEQWNDQLLIDTRKNLKTPKFCAVSAVVNQSRLSAYVFRNYSLPIRVQSQYCGGYKHQVWEAVRASAAAPTYFEECKIGDMLHQDGGILFNNPAAVAIHEAKLLWPNTAIQCVVSFGTGRSLPITIINKSSPEGYSCSSWKKKFYAILDSATDTEGVHTMLSDLLPTNVYFRFNPYLTEMLDIAEINPTKLEQLERDALMYLRRNEDKFQNAVKAINQQKKFTQKALDWLRLKKEIHGLSPF